jgi:N-acetylglucosaminyldiphosphoundecaprenol N-acetyl-beta-D-mannosaminyltransferase
VRNESIAGVGVDFDLTYREVMSQVDKFVASPHTNYLWTLNPEIVMDAQKDHKFRKLLNEAAIATPDGAGLLMADKYLNHVKSMKKDSLFPLKAFLYGITMGVRFFVGLDKLPERITGSELIYKLCEHAEKKGYNVFFLGGWEKDLWGNRKETHGFIAKRAADSLKTMYPRLKVVGTTSDFNRIPKDDKPTLDYIKETMRESKVDSIDLIFVAYNHKFQEEWLERNMSKIPAKVGIGIGGTLDYVIGTQKRPTQAVTRRNMEWLYRLFTQPWRMRRILKAFPTFPLFVYHLAVTNRKK